MTLKINIAQDTSDIGYLGLCLNPTDLEVYSEPPNTDSPDLINGRHITLFHYPANAIPSSVEEWIEENTDDIGYIARLCNEEPRDWHQIELECSDLHEEFSRSTWPHGYVEYK